MQHIMPLTPEMLKVIKRNINTSAQTFQTLTLDNNDILYPGGQRAQVGSQNWPIIDALNFFEQEGAVMIKQDAFEIINLAYFRISFSSLELPVQFSIDKRIEAAFLVVSALQADLFEIENRLRFQFEERLIKVFGRSFVSRLPSDVRNSITREKNNPKWLIAESRTRELEFTNFSDLLKVAVIPQLYVDNKVRKTLVDKLDYLSEARTRIAHNNPISPDDNVKIKEYANQVRRLLQQLKPIG